ncbi:transcription factor HES-5-like [Brienomyrus brachyistius]|uniref:transcription factor HES-5-like n=1 Tax=Brienomyrus brachyistius TaxID=42636 RepID=UPI0020B35B0B|nr:transcription factor HES-5-like [Brienomyrus brachyistius]
MAPYSYCSDAASLKMSGKEKNKLRKPVVEKMRRDRINSCIEQLKKLLEKEFQQQDPNAKLEKADVLEMTVTFLKQQLRPRASVSAVPRAHSEGYTQCWRETLHFLSSCKGAVPLQWLHCLHGSQRATQQLYPMSPASSTCELVPVKQEPGAEKPIWRPW